MDVLHPSLNRALAPSPSLSPPRERTGSTPATPTLRGVTVLSFLLTDVVALALVTGLVLLVGAVAGMQVSVRVLMPAYWSLMAAYGLFGLYNAVAMHPAQELRVATALAFSVFVAYYLALRVWIEAGPALSHDVLLAGSLAVVVIPILRAFSRVLLARSSWWGVPAVVVASKEVAPRLIWTLRRWPELGLKPVALLYDDDSYADLDGVQVLQGTKVGPMMATYGIPYVIVSRPDLDARSLADLVGRYSKFYERVFVIPDVSKASALWTARSSNEGLVGYGVRHSARSRIAQLAKRFVDVVAALLGLVLLAPLLLVVAVLVKLDSEGSVLYRQHRMGQSGRCFQVLKFRSMYQDAEERLQEILQVDPEKREEYAIYHKLHDDPRVTAIGTFLRRYSLDEIPQLWNVLRGDLSLVGPRAYMPGELDKMGGIQHVILQNRPGITGLWQVSGRNELSFQERLEVDVHYVHNWTPWLDLYIIARTFPVVLRGEGAA